MLKNKKNLSGFVFFLFTLSILSNLKEINTENANNDFMRIRHLLDLIPRFKGKGYTNKIDITYDLNKFNCKINSPITAKEYSFLSNSGYSLCSDKIFEKFDELAEKIKLEISQNLEPKILEKMNFMKEFKHVLYFAYQLTYLQTFSQNEKKIETPKDNFFDSPKISFTQRDIIENLQSHNFNLFEINNLDLNILNNYIHAFRDINLMELKEKINKIILNIEKAFEKKEGFRNWIYKNSKIVKYFIGVVWKNAINIDFE
jgi:hypothetical protein